MQYLKRKLSVIFTKSQDNFISGLSLFGSRRWGSFQVFILKVPGSYITNKI